MRTSNSYMKLHVCTPVLHKRVKDGVQEYTTSVEQHAVKGPAIEERRGLANSAWLWRVKLELVQKTSEKWTSV